MFRTRLSFLKPPKSRTRVHKKKGKQREKQARQGQQETNGKTINQQRSVCCRHRPLTDGALLAALAAFLASLSFSTHGSTQLGSFAFCSLTQLLLAHETRTQTKHTKEKLCHAHARVPQVRGTNTRQTEREKDAGKGEHIDRKGEGFIRTWIPSGDIRREGGVASAAFRICGVVLVSAAVAIYAGRLGARICRICSLKGCAASGDVGQASGI